jgi:hypothetical protein
VIAGLLLAGLLVRPDAAGALAIFDFSLTRSPESIGSYYRPGDSALAYYDPGTVMTLELPTSGGAIQSGVARITNFSLPGYIFNFGLYFQFTSVPDVIEGTVQVSGGQAEISFPDISVDFERGSLIGNANPGTLVFTLSTAGATIPAGCAYRTSDQEIPGNPLDLATGELGLVAAVCPYYVNRGTPEEPDWYEYNDAFRLALRGVVSPSAVPEPGTFALVAGGLLLVAGGARRGRVR